MQNDRMRAFFDERAATWDTTVRHDAEKIMTIISLAGPLEGKTVLDAACGTGVLVPHLLSAGAARIVSLDLSPNMIEAAKQNYSDPRVRFVAGDLFDCSECGFDTVFLYSAYPHFLKKEKLFAHIRSLLAPSGRFVIAHSNSRMCINGGHSGKASDISTPLLPVGEEAARIAPWFDIDIQIDTDRLYVLSGIARL
ncbi:class I SAM-dependent methyltransferase [Oscillospiraceae bacterium OttesenSCG-928-G22]|nr:class I SAM-dependent methyltransferase [Oscillospiraceae bacterium OttesenSCG-928-G22]